MIYFDFAESCWGFKVFVRIFVSARWNKSIWNCETNISAYLNADYFLQMIYFDFAERFWGLEVSVRIFVWNKSIWNCVTYIYPKCKSVCWLLSADDFEIATNGPNVANCNSVRRQWISTGAEGEVLGTSSGQVLLRNRSPLGETVK